ncbi:MAG: squalene/phytoene synthase family protein [Hymenobacter sp.]
MAGRGGPAVWFEQPQTAQGRNLKPYVAMFSLSRQPFDDLVDGVEMDLHRSRYDTFDELIGYCRRVASAVGVMCIEVFGCRDSRSRDYAFNLGLALQVTNIIRDVEADLQQGRVYLPQGRSREIRRQ